KAVELSPDDPEWLGGRGIARYRTDNWQGAKTDLQKSTDLRKLKTPGDLGNQAGQYFFLAMAHWKLGEKDKARPCYEKAEQLLKKLGEKDAPVLKYYRAEAATLLGLEKKD